MIYVESDEENFRPESAEQAFDNMAQDLGIGGETFDSFWTGPKDAETARDLLWTGWFDDDVDADERVEAREAFFDYVEFSEADFDWDQWKEWYENAA